MARGYENEDRQAEMQQLRRQQERDGERAQAGRRSRAPEGGGAHDGTRDGTRDDEHEGLGNPMRAKQPREEEPTARRGASHGSTDDADEMGNRLPARTDRRVDRMDDADEMGNPLPADGGEGRGTGGRDPGVDGLRESKVRAAGQSPESQATRNGEEASRTSGDPRKTGGASAEGQGPGAEPAGGYRSGDLPTRVRGKTRFG